MLQHVRRRSTFHRRMVQLIRAEYSALNRMTDWDIPFKIVGNIPPRLPKDRPKLSHGLSPATGLSEKAPRKGCNPKGDGLSISMVFKSEPHPWLQPISRRIGVTVFSVLWLGFESWSEPGSMWFWLALCVVAWAIWDFFLSENYRSSD